MKREYFITVRKLKYKERTLSQWNILISDSRVLGLMHLANKIKVPEHRF